MSTEASDQDLFAKMGDLMNLDGIDGLEGEEITQRPPTVLKMVTSSGNETDDRKADYEHVRTHTHYQSQMIFEMAKIVLEQAKNADSPRYIEVFSTLMGQMTRVNQDIIKVHKEMAVINSKSGSPAIPSTTEPEKKSGEETFEGCPEDWLNEMQEQDEEDVDELADND